LHLLLVCRSGVFLRMSRLPPGGPPLNRKSGTRFPARLLLDNAMIGNISVIGLNSISPARQLFLLLIGGILLFAASPASAQICATPGRDGTPAGPITGVVNTYFPGTASVAANTTSITIGAGTGAVENIASGDLLIVIQMQDASINSANTSRYGDNVNNGPGSGYTAPNGVGLYEFVKATTGVLFSGGTLTIQGAGGGGGLINAYTNANATGTQGARRFQVVRVPQYNNVTLSSGLTANAWNGSTGGILALDVAGTLSLGSSTVSVAGLGFRGGAGLRLQGSGGSNADYRTTAPATATTLTGFHGSKGEGIAGTPRYVWNAAGAAVVDTGVEGYPNGSMARGAPGNAGGGSTDGNPAAANPVGNDQNSGGGGGGNGGDGGVGGNTWSTQLVTGGAGGVSFAERAAGRVVLGGGGGAGTRNNDIPVASSSGAAGGGIVIIRAGAVTGTGSINASGAAAFNDTTKDGGGGGGAGGSVIVLTLSGNLSNLTVIAIGGRGGDAWRTQAPGANPGERHGPGGGGGGGVIFLSRAALSATVTGGVNGITTTANSAYGATGGAAGPTTVTNMTPGQIPGVQPGGLCPLAPTDVAFVSMKATRYDSRVLLEWQTGYEVNNVGFNIYREENGISKKVTPEPVAGSALIAGPGILMKAGFAYSWWDNSAKDVDDPSVRYWLEDIDLSGRTSTRGPYGIEAPPAGSTQAPAGKGKVSLLSALGREASEKSSAQIATRPVERMAGIVKLKPALMQTQSVVASSPAIKLSVQREGWYRIEQPQLVAAGLPADVDPRRLQLFVDGKEVPMRVTGEPKAKGNQDEKGDKHEEDGEFVSGEKDGTLDSTDAVEFYGIGINSTSTANHVYWLVTGAKNGERIKTNARGKGGSPMPASFAYTVERRDKIIYFSTVKNGGGEKFYGPILYNAQAVDQSVILQNVDETAGNATLEVSLQGLTLTPHLVKVIFNGSELTTMEFVDQQNGTATVTIPQSSLKEGTNQVQLSGPAGYSDMSLVEYVRVTYQHTNRADGNELMFPGTGGQMATIGGFSNASVRVMDVTDPGSVQDLNCVVSQEGTTYTVTATVPSTGARKLLAFAGDQQKTVAGIVADEPSSWRTTGLEVDYVVITRKELIDSLQPLVAQRATQGLKTAVVSIEDIYDEFSFGNKTPQAVKDFLLYAKLSWKKAPRFVVLAGDATYDPKNYTGVGDFDLVPTKLIETNFNETATDDWFVDFDGDGVPEMAIGRLPVRTAQETSALVSKIVGYDQSQPTNKVVLVADHNEGFDFEGADAKLKALIPANLEVTDIRRGQVGDSNARSQLLDALNAGASVVNYYGHGSTRLWSDAQILTAADPRSLGNVQHLSLFVSMTCLNGYFLDPSVESLGESLLKAPGGAIAVWASAGITDAEAQVLMSQEAIRQLFSGGESTIGEVTARAKSATYNNDVRRTWILLGDPATKLK
jgi:peptidase C25-like protein